MKKRYTDEQIIGFPKHADAGTPIKGLCRQHGFPDAPFYRWPRDFGGMDVTDARKQQESEAGNVNLNKSLAEMMLDNDALKVVVRGQRQARTRDVTRSR